MKPRLAWVRALTSPLKNYTLRELIPIKSVSPSEMGTGLRMERRQSACWHMYLQLMGTSLNKILSVHIVKDRCRRRNSIFFLM